jgi:flavin-binding protein dodecin
MLKISSQNRRKIMAVARVTEIISGSSESFEDAVRKGMKRASKTLNNVRGAWVEGQKVVCNRDGEIKEYRVNLKVSFVLAD